jgi:DNA-binding CsgD family transcriptional regulator
MVLCRMALRVAASRDLRHVHDGLHARIGGSLGEERRRLEQSGCDGVTEVSATNTLHGCADGVEVQKIADGDLGPRRGRRSFVRAAALEDAGRVNRDRDSAVELLDQAHDIYVGAGALRDAARIRQRLRGLGARRRQVRQDVANSLAGLTPSELAVVELVARGATNREVAAQLFLSPHTVSTHLRHAFAKVGVRSRVELTRLATLGESHGGQQN